MPNPESVYTIEDLENEKGIYPKVPGYYVKSTATINVEDPPEPQQHNDSVDKIKEIANYLIKSDQPELVFHIHGYANSEEDAKNRYNKACKYANSPDSGLTPDNRNCVFIGYRWPAESPLVQTGNSLESLPSLIVGILITSLVFGLIAIILTLWTNTASNFILTSLLIIILASGLGLWIRHIAKATDSLRIIPNGLLLVFFAWLFGAIFSLFVKNPYPWLIFVIVLFVLLIGIILALIILRVTSYPRDRFRASNYGVLDLVKFFQYLQKEISDKDPKKNWGDLNRIKVSFVAHSLGCEVATQTIRILSDVFDTSALDEKPSSNIGAVFKLGRLVLVAPDIPVESILTSRANFLKSSLRRCEEAYIFSNEADLALRLASTAANYFSFPTKTRDRGYKLGNVTVDNKKSLPKDYGIVNCQNADFTNPTPPSKYLEIRASSNERKRLHCLNNNVPLADEVTANSFTYFDCTDYTDCTDKERSKRGILSFSKKQSALNFWDYVQLCGAYFLKFPRHINVHGGYFEGEFCQLLINELAFLGSNGLLKRYSGCIQQQTGSNQSDELLLFSEDCKRKYIQVLLATRKTPFPQGESAKG
ncbi:alpha/beta hydrolase [Nostoc sp. UHCC 0926]|uniref:alpha/beta hydrolase n=1 Tax=unclassified Nostoc TaxID=2593658 RepID=UPI0023606476|nr:alpha/beta hydrolase [Nostoc sp. UHCC 0926]WDD30439.1 alpha/beta hydrolase [Nostoc sp. UHCC 0926]